MVQECDKFKNCTKELDEIQKICVIRVAEEYAKEMFNTSEERRVYMLASIVHQHDCRRDHVEWCNWYYDDGSWTWSARKDYLKIAQDLIESSRTYQDIFEELFADMFDRMR